MAHELYQENANSEAEQELFQLQAISIYKNAKTKYSFSFTLSDYVQTNCLLKLQMKHQMAILPNHNTCKYT